MEKRRDPPAEESERPIRFSVVVAVSERPDDLREVYDGFSKELATFSDVYEFVFVLDGPRHVAIEQLRELKSRNPRIEVLVLNRPVGEATALSVGFGHARGQVVITVPPYFQVNPRGLSRLLQSFLDEESDLVVARRHPRIDSAFNRWQSRVFHWVVCGLTRTQFRDVSCGLRVMKSQVAKEIQLYGDLHRFFPILALERGFRVTELEVEQSSRDTQRRLHRPGVYLRRLLDVLTLFFLFKFTRKPLRFFGLVGTFLGVCGTIITGYLGIYRLVGLGGIAGRPLLILGVLLIVLGVQLFSIGLLGEIIIFTHRKDQKEYAVDVVLD